MKKIGAILTGAAISRFSENPSRKLLKACKTEVCGGEKVCTFLIKSRLLQCHEKGMVLDTQDTCRCTCPKKPETCAGNNDYVWNPQKCGCVPRQQCPLQNACRDSSRQEWDYSQCKCVPKAKSCGRNPNWVNCTEGYRFDASKCGCVSLESPCSIETECTGGFEWDKRNCKCVMSKATRKAEIKFRVARAVKNSFKALS